MGKFTSFRFIKFESSKKTPFNENDKKIKINSDVNGPSSSIIASVIGSLIEFSNENINIRINFIK